MTTARDQLAALHSALQSLLPGYCEKWCPPPLCAPGEIHNVYCAKAQAALARGLPEDSARAPTLPAASEKFSERPFAEAAAIWVRGRPALPAPEPPLRPILASTDCNDCGARSGEHHANGCDIYGVYFGERAVRALTKQDREAILYNACAGGLTAIQPLALERYEATVAALEAVLPADEKGEILASAAIEAQRQGFETLCFGCLQGFNEANCPRCLGAALPAEPEFKINHWANVQASGGLPAEHAPPEPAIYVASKTCHATAWRELRASGAPIISTWIDEAGPGETTSNADLWRRCVEEAARCTALILYAEKDEQQRGALVEVGVALGNNRPVIVSGSAPPWRFENHPRVLRVDTKEQALRAALAVTELGGARPALAGRGFTVELLQEWLRECSINNDEVGEQLFTAEEWAQQLTAWLSAKIVGRAAQEGQKS